MLCHDLRIDFTFNPRSYKRSDIYSTTISKSQYAFNPRSYKRSDTVKAESQSDAKTFNPRSYKRSDDMWGDYLYK